MRWPVSTLALLSLVTISGLTTVILAGIPLRVEERIARRGVAYPAPASLSSGTEPDLMVLAALRTTPIFYRSRETVKVEDPAAIAASMPQYVLIAALTAPGGASVAYVRSASGKDAQRVRPGDNLEGWAVKSIEVKKVILARAGQTTEILANTKPAAVGLTRRLVSASVLPESTATRVLTAHGASAATPSQAVHATREARTYRPPAPFPTAPVPKS